MYFATKSLRRKGSKGRWYSKLSGFSQRISSAVLYITGRNFLARRPQRICAEKNPERTIPLSAHLLYF